LANEPITVFGDGTQTRCFTNVFDVVEALVRLADTDASIGEVVNVGQPSEISVLDLAHLVRELCGSSSPIELVDYNEAYGPSFEDMRRRVPNVDRLRRLTGFVPETSLEDTIRQIIESMRGNDSQAEPTDGPKARPYRASRYPRGTQTGS
jgi:UDP-glucose 4-epimerase